MRKISTTELKRFLNGLNTTFQKTEVIYFRRKVLSKRGTYFFYYVYPYLGETFLDNHIIQILRNSYDLYCFGKKIALQSYGNNDKSHSIQVRCCNLFSFYKEKQYEKFIILVSLYSQHCSTVFIMCKNRGDRVV